MEILNIKAIKKYYGTVNNQVKALDGVDLEVGKGDFLIIQGASGSGDSDIMMIDTINPLKSKFKGFHKTFKQDDLGLNLSSFLLN